MRTTPRLAEVLVAPESHRCDEIAFPHLLNLCCNRWLNCSVIERILKLFDFWYGQSGKFPFILYVKEQTPPQFRQMPEKVFGILNVNENHWVAIELDYKNRKIRYGDSMGREVDQEKLDEFIKWLMGGKYHQWATAMNKVGQLLIQRQLDSSSCGLFALSALEWAANKYADKSHVNPVTLRIRFLGHVAGITKVCFALLFP
jgi:hypothetical protein